MAVVGENMCDEMSKATKRRACISSFPEVIFQGHGLDIGCGYDKMSVEHFPKITAIDGYDQCLGNGDAQLLADIPDNKYDFVVSSHCLEHMRDPYEAVRNWLRVLKHGGYLVITVPDWDMYEHRQWPSKFNGDHKTSWTMNQPDMPHVINAVDFVHAVNRDGTINVVKIAEITANYNPALDKSVDQTGGPAECCIEMVLYKRTLAL